LACQTFAEPFLQYLKHRKQTGHREARGGAHGQRVDADPAVAQTVTDGHEHQDVDDEVANQIVVVAEAAALAGNTRQLAVHMIDEIRNSE